MTIWSHIRHICISKIPLKQKAYKGNTAKTLVEIVYLAQAIQF